MKFGKYLDKQAKDDWRAFYLDYKGLKDLIKASAKEAETSGPTAFSPRTTSLSIVRASKQADATEERFFQKLELEVSRACTESVKPNCSLCKWSGVSLTRVPCTLPM